MAKTMMGSELAERLSNAIKARGDMPVFLADQDRMGNDLGGYGLLEIRVLDEPDTNGNQPCPRIQLYEGGYWDFE